jgi:hypothetical protein
MKASHRMKCAFLRVGVAWCGKGVQLGVTLIVYALNANVCVSLRHRVHLAVWIV